MKSVDVTRVLLVDDHSVLRFGLRHALANRKGYEVCGEADSASAAVEMAGRLTPDVVILDLMLGDRDGCEAVGEILRFSPNSRVLVYSSHSEEIFAARALRAGASGYLMKTAGFEEFLRAIDEVRAGRTYLSPHLRVAQPMPNNELDVLTDREIQIFLRMGEGKTTNEIADQLHLSPKTVAAHRENIKVKLGITSSAELMRVAIAYIIGAGNPQTIQ